VFIRGAQAGRTVLVSNAAPSVVQFAGDLDFSSAPELEASGMQALAQAPDRPVLVDLGEVRFIDSAGLSALIELKRHANELGGSLALTKVTAPVRKILAVTGLLDVFGLDDPDAG
jgi:anti-anti-sigma factor